MRQTLGDGYTEALRNTWKDVPESADFVMYWWNHAAGEVRRGRTRRFGLITTNSLRQTFNRRVIEAHLNAKDHHPLALKFAVPDHPWVDSAHGAAVRIAMTVGVARLPDAAPAELLTLATETEGEVDSRDVTFHVSRGEINADLTIGANVAGALALRANDCLSTPGVKLHGAGFILTREDAMKLGLGSVAGTEKHIREYRNGRDLTDAPRGVMVIDLFGLSETEVRKQFPLLYQRVLGFVKPERDQNNRETYRKNWWIFGEPRKDMRPALVGLPRYVATVETAKHRTFQFLDATILPDNRLVAIALDGAFELGVLSANVHAEWALATGGTLEDRPVYNKSVCFETFPFPDIQAPKLRAQIADLAEEIDAHRKRQQAAHATVTITGMYNVIEKLKSGEALTAKDKVIHDDGLVAVLKSLHDELDRAVLTAYGWQDLVSLMDIVNGVEQGYSQTASKVLPRDVAKQELTATLLSRLVALNHERANEEKAGTVRWLRPEYQNPNALSASGYATATAQASLNIEAEQPDAEIASDGKRVWPDCTQALAAQIRAVADVLATSDQPLAATEIAKIFGKRATFQATLKPLLESLEAMGRARQTDDGKWMVA
jgi:hypothetical protein